MPTRAEIFRLTPTPAWSSAPEIKPGGMPGSFVAVPETGRATTYLFQPSADDSTTVVFKADALRRDYEGGIGGVPENRIEYLTEILPGQEWRKEIVDEEGNWGIVVVRHER